VQLVEEELMMPKHSVYFSREEAVEAAQKISKQRPYEIFVFWDGDYFQLSKSDPRNYPDVQAIVSAVFFDGEPA